MRETIKKLASVYGPVGREGRIADAIREMVAPYVDEVKQDALGNLICIRKGEGKRVMLAAHMDQIGLIVTDIDQNGCLNVHNVGAVRVLGMLNRHVVFANGTQGVVTYREEGFKPENAKVSDLFIDIGARNREEALKKISVGDVAVYTPDVFDLGVDCVCGTALDDRACCAMLVETLKALKTRNNEIYAVFTVQEEVGQRGVEAAAYEVNPELGIVLDVTHSWDVSKGSCGNPVLGKGPCVKVLDGAIICTPKVVEMIENAAERAEIDTQREVLTRGRTDGGMIQRARAGVPTGGVSLALRYVHSSCEVISVSDAEKGAELLVEILDNPIEI